MRNDIPSDSASNFGARVRETLMTYLGKQGDPLDRGVTLRDLVDSGFATLSNVRFGGGSAPLLTGPSVSGPYVPDLTPPPTPTGFAADAAITNLIVECDAPTYPQGNGHRQSRLYGAKRAGTAPQPVFASAVEITQFAGQVTSYATDPATEWHLWLKWESNDGVLSVNPAGGTNGLVVTTGQDVAKLLEALTGQLTTSQLYADLGSRIELIDAPATFPGSVNARVAAVQSQVNDIQNTPAYSNTTTYTANTLVSYEGSIYQAKSTTTGNLPTDTTYWLKVGEYASLGGIVAAHTTQIGNVVSDLGAEVTARQALSASFNDPVTGLAATRSTLTTNYYTKAAADEAISAATTTLVSTTALNTALGNYTNTAGLVADYYTKTATDSAISSATQFLVSTTNLNTALSAYTNTASLTANYYTKTAADSAISQATQNLVSTTGLTTALSSYTNTATLNSLYYTKTGADSAITAATQNLVSTTALNTALGSYTTTAALTTNYYTKTDANTAISNATTNLVSNSGLATTLGNYPTNASLTTNYYTKTEANTAISNATTNLVSSSTLNNYTTTAALQANYFTKASGNALEGKYTVKVDLNGYVSGFGLASTANDAGATSAFAVRSDSFFIASPSGPGITPTAPFIVRTTPVNLGGVEVPVGVYITDGYIQNGTITNAKIANLAVDSAKIASITADKIIAGSINVGQYIQSSNYVSGSAGWKIDGGGSAEFGAASIRGQLVASQINSNGLSIRAADGTVILSAGSSLGASAFSGNVTGTVAGTAASTVVNTANNAASAASTAQGTANSAASAASTAQGTANSAAAAASTAQGTANSAAAAASTAQSTANSAASAASAAQLAADAKLARSGAQVLTGPVTLNAASAITVGNPALNGQAGFNGFYIGSTGIVGTQNGLTTFALDNAGNATFKGNLTGASGTFGGNLAVGNAPVATNGSMTGTGAIINSGGTFALGNNTNNISFNGSNITLNGDVIATGNLKTNSVTNTLIDSFNGVKSLLNSHGRTWQPAASVSTYIANTGSTVLISCTGDSVIGIVAGNEGESYFYSPSFRLVRNGVVVYHKPAGGPTMNIAEKDLPVGNYNYVFEMQNSSHDSIYFAAYQLAGVNFPLLNVTELKR
jgi:hypothetical protein